MNTVRYRTDVRRRRGKWHVTVPGLPRDAPVVRVDKLSNAEVLVIEELSRYLGVSYSAIEVEVKQPRRRSLRDRLTPLTAQVGGGLGALTGLYLVTGPPVTLIAASVAMIALGTLRELGKV